MSCIQIQGLELFMMVNFLLKKQVAVKSCTNLKDTVVNFVHPL